MMNTGLASRRARGRGLAKGDPPSLEKMTVKLSSRAPPAPGSARPLARRAPSRIAQATFPAPSQISRWAFAVPRAVRTLPAWPRSCLACGRAKSHRSPTFPSCSHWLRSSPRSHSPTRWERRRLESDDFCADTSPARPPAPSASAMRRDGGIRGARGRAPYVGEDGRRASDRPTPCMRPAS
jgi:hypothetical protein